MSTIYIDEQGVELKRKGELIILEKDDQKIGEIPIAICDRIIIAGNIQISTQTLALLLEKEIPVSFMTIYGNYRGKLLSPSHKNIQLRIKQYERYKDEKFRLKISKEIAKTKIKNSKIFLQKHQRNNEEIDTQKEINEIDKILDSIEKAEDIEALNGYEGSAARSYFQAFGKLFKNDFTFEKRTKRPPKDPVNAILSLGYTLLFNELYTAIEAIGLDPYLGFLHQIEYGRASLAVDLAEEFRFLIDGLALTLINKEIIKKEDFLKGDEDSTYLCEKGRETFYKNYEKKINTELQYKNMTLTYRRIFFHHTEHLARVIMGEEVYSGFETR